MTKDVTILFGAPGTGKTTRMISEIQKNLEQGVSPERIACMTFSRKAAKEVLERSLVQFNLPKSAFPWFRTLHSTSFKQLGLKRGEVMSSHHFKEFGVETGMLFSEFYNHETDRVPIDCNAIGDRCLSLYARSKARGWSIEEEWRYANEWNLTLRTVESFKANLESYKAYMGLVDFTDMIQMAPGPLDVDVIYIDEAQDLTTSEWEAARRFGANAEKVFIAGDDDQAIYGFSGANANPLLTLRGKRIILPLSYRLPMIIKGLVDQITSRIMVREPKKFSPRDSVGWLGWLREAEDIDLSEGTWLLLCRNRSQLARLEEVARRQNVVYHSNGSWSNEISVIKAVVSYEHIRKGVAITATEARNLLNFIPGLKLPEELNRISDWSQIQWPFAEKPTWLKALDLTTEDREYIRGLRRRGESLTKPGRVVISTVHGAKGGEAENVLLLTDISGRVAKGILKNPDDEWRVLHVGVSRAIERLYLVQPQTQNFWSI